jgi:hypothetical protein
VMPAKAGIQYPLVFLVAAYRDYWIARSSRAMTLIGESIRPRRAFYLTCDSF